MEKDFEIEIISDEDENEDAPVQLPLNFIAFGEFEHDDVKVYIRQNVYKALEKYASSDTSKELGTILIGDYCEELGKMNVIISDYIEAKYTDASAATLTFTHETWDYIHKQHEKLYPDKKIIGWQHTHPSYGIFLSNYDLFIQDNFFNLPFQVAYVIDPVQGLRGFFQWKNGKTEKLRGYYIYDEVGKPIKIEAGKKTDASAKAKASGGKAAYPVITLLCVLSLALGLFAVNTNGKYKAQLAAQAALAAELDKEKATVSELEKKLIDGLLEDSSATVQELIDRIESGEIRFENSDELLPQLKNLIKPDNGDTKSIRLVSYTVMDGDSLSDICASHNIDYSAYEKVILALNGISDPNHILPGQAIILPVE